MQQIDWLEYYTEHGEDPKFDCYGRLDVEIMRNTEFGECAYDAIDRAIADGSPGDPLPEFVTIQAANTELDDEGKPTVLDDDPWDKEAGEFSTKDNTEIRINVREWCRINDAMDLLEVDDATE